MAFTFPKLYEEFLKSEKTGGFLLLTATLISLVLSNSFCSYSYALFWDLKFANHSISHWINEGLMAIFFLLVGLELKREIFFGALSNKRKAALPILGAVGGMVVPVLIYIIINVGSSKLSGAGIPMATDIAFAIGILSLLGNKVPTSLKIILTALAVIDDLGAIVTIAIFYSHSVSFLHLAAAGFIWLLLYLLGRRQNTKLYLYLLGGFMLWYCMLHSGVHASISGVMLAFTIPFKQHEKSLSAKLQHYLHKPVAFVILPLFALANTNLLFDNITASQIFSLNGWGILFGLVLGKPLGILLFSYLGVKNKICELPKDLAWKHILGMGMLGGVGFTMSIFISLLAFKNPQIISASKAAILIASAMAGLISYYYFKQILQKTYKAIT